MLDFTRPEEKRIVVHLNGAWFEADLHFYAIADRPCVEYKKRMFVAGKLSADLLNQFTH